MKRLSVALALMGLAHAANAGEFQWEPAFPRPNGVYLIDEAAYEPLPFYIDHRGEKLRMAGKFTDFTFGQDLVTADIYAQKMFAKGAFAALQFVDRLTSARVRCVSALGKEELRRLSKLPRGTDVMFEGDLTHFGDGLFTLENCTVQTEVNLFHAGDKSILLGSWCYASNGTTKWIVTFSRDEQGQYHKRTAYEDGSVFNNPVEISRTGDKFRMLKIYENGERGYAEHHVLFSPFKLSTSYRSLSKPQGIMARCTKLDRVD